MKKNKPATVTRTIVRTTSVSEPLEAIAHRLGCSNVRAMQFALQHTYKVLTADLRPRANPKHGLKQATTIYIPFSTRKQVSEAKNIAKKHANGNFTLLCKLAVIHTYSELDELPKNLLASTCHI